MARVEGALLIGALLTAVGCRGPNPAFRSHTSDADVRPPLDASADLRNEQPSVEAAATEPGPATEAAPSIEGGPGPPDVVAEALPEVAADGALDMSPARPARRVTLTSAAGTSIYGTTGSPFGSEDCPDDQVLVGYLLWTSDPAGVEGVGQLEGRCAEMWISAGPPFTVELRTGANLAAVGMDRFKAHTALCGTNQVLVSFFGRTGGSLDRIGFECATFEVTAPPTPGPRVASMTRLGPFGGSGGTRDFQQACPPGTVARGHAGHGRDWVDAWGLHCGTPNIPP